MGFQYDADPKLISTNSGFVLVMAWTALCLSALSFARVNAARRSIVVSGILVLASLGMLYAVYNT